MVIDRPPEKAQKFTGEYLQTAQGKSQTGFIPSQPVHESRMVHIPIRGDHHPYLELPGQFVEVRGMEHLHHIDHIGIEPFFQGGEKMILTQP